MKHQKLWHASLPSLLGIYFVIYFPLLFIACLLGHIIHDVFSNEAFDFESLFSSVLFALTVSFLTTIIYWYTYKDIFVFLNNDRLEIPQNHDTTKIVRPYQSFQIEAMKAKLEKSGMVVTYINPTKNIIKFRQKLIFFGGCGGILHFDSSTEELHIISFSLTGNILNDYKKRVIDFNTNLYRGIELHT